MKKQPTSDQTEELTSTVTLPKDPATATETADSVPHPEPATLAALLAEAPDAATQALVQRAYDLGMDNRPARAQRAPRGDTKREQAAALLARPEGTTAREILDLTKWPAVSVPALAKASGLVLEKQKDGAVTRYFGRAA